VRVLGEAVLKLRKVEHCPKKQVVGGGLMTNQQHFKESQGIYSDYSDNQPIRVLHIINGMGSGGAESFIMNVYRKINRERVQFDFLLRSRENIYSKEIEELGGKVFYTSTFPRHFLKNRFETMRFFQTHMEYAAVHVHGNALIYTCALTTAYKAGIDFRIMHSHNTDAPESRITEFCIILTELESKNWRHIILLVLTPRGNGCLIPDSKLLITASMRSGLHISLR